jgi:hypothetical protein
MPDSNPTSDLYPEAYALADQIAETYGFSVSEHVAVTKLISDAFTKSKPLPDPGQIADSLCNPVIDAFTEAYRYRYGFSVSEAYRNGFADAQRKPETKPVTESDIVNFAESQAHDVAKSIAERFALPDSKRFAISDETADALAESIRYALGYAKCDPAAIPEPNGYADLQPHAEPAADSYHSSDPLPKPNRVTGVAVSECIALAETLRKRITDLYTDDQTVEQSIADAIRDPRIDPDTVAVTIAFALRDRDRQAYAYGLADRLTHGFSKPVRRDHITER